MEFAILTLPRSYGGNRVASRQPVSRIPSEERLCERLNAGLSYRLTLVVARGPMALSGVSRVLITRWPKAAPCPVRHLVVAVEDNCPTVFLNHVAGAVGDISTVALDPALPVEDRVTDLLNALIAVRQDFALALVGYDLIRVRAVHAIVETALDYLPMQMHVVLACRVPPPLTNLARLRARCQLLEISWPG